MQDSTPPKIECRQQYPVLPVKNINEAINFYTKKLGFSLGFIWGDPPVYGGVTLGEVAIHLSAQMGKGKISVVNFVVDDADALCAYHLANNVQIVEPINDREYGIRDYCIADTDGNMLSFGHNIYTGDPIPIKRVEAPLRLEKRLAALLKDLAEHKHMSIDSCVEETLLHTFERIGDSVASPHTINTLNYIEELKKKHGIDYDVHGSYRFVEKGEK
ncbi:MAG: VOC family protein [Sediminibacterium sp.]